MKSSLQIKSIKNKTFVRFVNACKINVICLKIFGIKVIVIVCRAVHLLCSPARENYREYVCMPWALYLAPPADD